MQRRRARRQLKWKSAPICTAICLPKQDSNGRPTLPGQVLSRTFKWGEALSTLKCIFLSKRLLETCAGSQEVGFTQPLIESFSVQITKWSFENFISFRWRVNWFVYKSKYFSHLLLAAKFACPEQLMPFLSAKSPRIHLLAGEMTTFPNWAMRHHQHRAAKQIQA